jgi:hypothetical protein
MASTFLLETEVEEEKFPMSPVLIQQEQSRDKELQKDIQKNIKKYRIRKIEGADNNNNSLINSVTTIATKALPSPGASWAVTTIPVRQHTFRYVDM